MEAKNPYRSNEFCVNWEDNLIATSMGDAYEVGKQAGRREVVELGEVLGNGSFVRIDIPMTEIKEWGLNID